jgi:uncharacterized protein
MLKQTLWLGVINLAVITFSPATLAVTVQEVPSPRQTGGWVTDRANILSPETEAELNRLITELEAQNGSEIMVVTVPETSPYSSPKEFTTTWFNYWHIGKKGQDNGVLFMYSQGDNRIEIETGYGVEDILPDAQVGNLIRTQIRPRFNQGDFDGGTVVGTQKLIEVLKTYQPHQSPNSSTTEAPSSSVIPSPIIDKKYIALFKVGGILLAIVSGGGMLVLSRRPVLISPQRRDRIKGLDKHDKIIYYLACLCFFSTTFTTAIIVGGGLVSASIAGGMNCFIFSRWLNRSRMERSNAAKNTFLGSEFDVLLKYFILVLVLKLVIGLVLMYATVLELAVLLELAGSGTTVALITGGILYFPLSLLPKKIFDKDRKSRSIRPLHCNKCQLPMTQLDSTSLLSRLSQAESVAQTLGSVLYEGWECSRCRPKLIAQGINLRAYVLDSKNFSLCPSCQELTVTCVEEILVHATQYSEGKKQLTYECECCYHHNVTEKTIPRIRSSSSGYSGGGFDSGGYSGGGDSGGGGGGDSGGGGAGG